MPVLTTPPDSDDAAESARAERDLRRDAGATIAIVVLFGGAVGLSLCTGPRPDDAHERCAVILDKYVELRQRAADPKAPLHVFEEKRDDARKLALEGGELLRCTRSISVESAACADRAQTADEIERCFP